MGILSRAVTVLKSNFFIELTSQATLEDVAAQPECVIVFVAEYFYCYQQRKKILLFFFALTDIFSFFLLFSEGSYFNNFQRAETVLGGQSTVCTVCCINAQTLYFLFSALCTKLKKLRENSLLVGSTAVCWMILFSCNRPILKGKEGEICMVCMVACSEFYLRKIKSNFVFFILSQMAMRSRF